MGIRVITGDGAYGEPQGRDSQNITVIGQDDVIPTGKDVATEARYAPYINMVTMTWWQYDVTTRGFVDTHISPNGPQGEPGDDYVITQDDYAAIAAIAYDNIGDLDDLTTTAQSNLVAAVNEVDGKFVPKSGGTFTGQLIVNKANTTTESTQSLLTVGNSTPSGTAGASYGLLQLFGDNDKYLFLRPVSGNLAANRTINLPDASGTIMLNAGGTFTGRVTINEGKSSTTSQNWSGLVLGNNIAVGTASNSAGFIALYSTSQYYAELSAAAGLTANRIIRLPDASGTIALDANAYQYMSEINSGTSKSFTIPNSYRGLLHIACESETTGRNGLYSVVASSTGTLYVVPFVACSIATITKATNKLTIAITTANCYIGFIGTHTITTTT